MTTPDSPRETFVTSRSLEYFEIRSLEPMTGHLRHEFPTALLKELLDNALDAAETAGVSPEIDIRVVQGDELTITVSDNGPGMSPALIKQVLDFSSTVSDKARYRSPTRGQQGNAWKTVLGMPYALGSREPVVIESRGVRHEITPEVVGGHVHVEHVMDEVDEVAGTTVTVTLPRACLHPDFWEPEQWVAAAALVNPHALIQVSVSDLGHDPATERVESYKPTVGDDWSKLVPSDSGSVWWYDLDAFTGLVFAQAAKKDLLLSEFVAKFKGLSGSTKAAAIRRELPGATRLSTLNRGAVPALFEAMRAQSTAPKPTPKTLGAVGQDHYLTVIDSLFGVVRDGRGEPRCWYRGFTCDDDVPWLVEAFVAEVEDPGQVFYAINHSPITGDPLADTWLCASATDSYSGRPKVEAVGVGSFLHATYAHPDYLRSEHRAVVIHLVCPSPAFTTKGKSTLKVSPVVRETVGKGLWLTTKKLYAEGRRRERDAAAADRAYEERMRPVRDSAPDLNDAVFAVMPAAIAKATGNGELPTAQRQLFYVVRQMVLGLDDPPQGGLTYSYFSRLLTEYQQRHGSIPGLYYDPRGTLVEPHTGRRVPLGTREVDDYVVPEYVYDKILYVEKEGLQPVFEAAGIAGRFDLAIAYGKGHATAAARVLADRAEKDHGITVFCLHDADLYGYDIARVLGEETERMPGHCVDVVDLGLKVADAIELDLPTETFTRKSAISAALIPALTDIELEWFTGRPAPSGEGWIGTRVELNAFDSPGLIAYVESKLEAAGASTKIVPPADVLAATAEAKRAAAVRAEFDEWIARFLDTDAIVTRALNELPNQERDWEELVREQLAQRPELWWRTVVGDAVASDLDEHRDDMPARLRTLLTEALQGRDRYGQ